jgi:hypothetical protein
MRVCGFSFGPPSFIPRAPAAACRLRAVADHRPLFLGERREQLEDERVSLSATLGKQEWIISGGAMRTLGEWDNQLTVSDI